MKLPSFIRNWTELERFRRQSLEERSIVFYAEDQGSWPHFEGLVDHLITTLGRSICYVTSSTEDPVLESANNRLSPFCIGPGAARTSFFRSLEADAVVMTMPDIETFHIKRSKRGGNYVYVHHSMISTHMAYRPEAFDHFDTIFCVGPHHHDETRARESLLGLQAKKLVRHGYGRLDSIIRSASDRPWSRAESGQHTIVIAPSWG